MLPKNDANFVIGEVLAPEQFHLLVRIIRRPAILVAGLNPVPVFVDHPVSLVAEGFRLLFILQACVDQHDFAFVAVRLVVAQ